MKRALRLILIGAIVSMLAVGGVSVWALQAKSTDFAFVPRAAQPTLGAVKLEDEKLPPKDAGRVFFTTIGVRHATVWETWLGVGGGGELVPEHAVRPDGESDQERTRLDAEAMDSSQDAATVVGLRALGYPVEVEAVGVQIAGMDASTPIAKDGAELGDLILKAAQRPVTTVASLRTIIADVGADRPVALDVHRNGDVRTINTATIAGANDRPILGIRPAQANTINAPRQVTYAIEGVGGPSAGLAFALQIYSAGKGYANLHGLRVAATGSLSMAGTVRPIGGVAEKAIGARRAGADIFLVPKANAAAARAAGVQDLTIIPVENFTQALRAIAETPRP
jgi:PDZ domain-containing protein